MSGKGLSQPSSMHERSLISMAVASDMRPLPYVSFGGNRLKRHQETGVTSSRETSSHRYVLNLEPLKLPLYMGLDQVLAMRIASSSTSLLRLRPKIYPSSSGYVGSRRFSTLSAHSLIPQSRWRWLRRLWSYSGS